MVCIRRPLGPLSTVYILLVICTFFSRFAFAAGFAQDGSSSSRKLLALINHGVHNSNSRQLLQQPAETNSSHYATLCATAQAPKVPATLVEAAAGMKIYVYNKGDIVSNSIQQQKTWESKELQQIMWALAAPLPLHHFDHSSDAGHGNDISGPAPAVFLDVGANIGWFTLSVAAQGYTVYAFEAMQDNQDFLSSSLCQNPGFRDRVTLFRFGLGTKAETCFMLAAASNQGDGHVICGFASVEQAQAHMDATYPSYKPYIARGELTTKRLDTVLATDIKVMKMDVEGYEAKVLEGARKLFAFHRVWFICLEYNRQALELVLRGTDENPFDFVYDLLAKGYKVSKTGFQGPWIPKTHVEALASEVMVNLYFAHRDYFRHHPQPTE